MGLALPLLIPPHDLSFIFVYILTWDYLYLHVHPYMGLNLPYTSVHEIRPNFRSPTGTNSIPTTMRELTTWCSSTLRSMGPYVALAHVERAKLGGSNWSCWAVRKAVQTAASAVVIRTAESIALVVMVVGNIGVNGWGVGHCWVGVWGEWCGECWGEGWKDTYYTIADIDIMLFRDRAVLYLR